jgi:hypothetical protein
MSELRHIGMGDCSAARTPPPGRLGGWETRPRKNQLAGLAAVRRLGKREARKRLEMIGEKK